MCQSKLIILHVCHGMKKVCSGAVSPNLVHYTQILGSHLTEAGLVGLGWESGTCFLFS